MGSKTIGTFDCFKINSLCWPYMKNYFPTFHSGTPHAELVSEYMEFIMLYLILVSLVHFIIKSHIYYVVSLFIVIFVYNIHSTDRKTYFRVLDTYMEKSFFNNAQI